MRDRPVVAKDDVAKTPVRFRSNRKAQRKVVPGQTPSPGSAHAWRKRAMPMLAELLDASLKSYRSVGRIVVNG